MRPDLVELSVAYITESRDAVKFEDGAAEFWIPKSILHWEDGTKYSHGDCLHDVETIAVPEWFANREGLI